jgi:predicted DNA binding protein
MTGAADSEHQAAAARHAKKRAARTLSKAGKKKPAKRRRVRERSAEPSPALDLTPAQLREVSEARRQALEADNRAAAERPSQLTPKQLKRLAVSEAKKAALRAKRRDDST